MIKAIIFDCFGVLVTTGRNKLFSDFPNHTVALHDLSMQSDYGIISRAEYDAAMAKLTGLSIEQLESKYWLNYTVNDSVLDWVRELKNNGQYKIGMLSNIGRGWLEDFISTSILSELFDDIVLSSEVSMIKPDPHLFRLAADRLGRDTNECVMIDDLESNVRGAENVGMSGILFSSAEVAKKELAVITKKES